MMKSDTFQRIGILGHVGNQNLGDEAIIAATIHNLREHYPAADIIAFTSNPEDTRQRHQIPAFPLRQGFFSRGLAGARGNTESPQRVQSLRNALKRTPIVYPALKWLRDFLSAAQGALREVPFLISCYGHVKGLDLLIVAGSQQLNDFAGVGGAWAFPYTVLKWTLLARASGAKVVLLSVGAGPIHSRVGKRFIRWILALASYRSFRDEYSGQVLKQMRVPGEFPFVPDLAFSLPIPDCNTSKETKRPVVGINPMPFFERGYWQIDPEYPRLYSEYVGKIVAMAEFTIAKGYDVWLFPTMLRADPRVIDDVRQQLAPEHRQHLVDGKVATLHDLLVRINGCQLIIATRYHGILLSLMMKKPVLALAYHEKSRDLMRMFGQERFVLDTGSFDIATFQKRFIELTAAGDKVELEVGSRLPEIRRALACQYDAVLGEPSGRVPKVSIGLPVYNGEQYIAETLDSILAQTFQDFELIICDNASEDGTEQICRSYAANDFRIRYVRNETNIGGNRNSQLALRLSRGLYFRWSACDDLSAPTSLETCVEVLDQHPDVILAYPKTVLIGDRGQLLQEYEDRLHLQSSCASDRFKRLTEELGLCNAVFGLMRANVLRKAGITIGNFVSADVPFLAELSLYGKFWEVPERLFSRRIHPGAYSSMTDTNRLYEWCVPGSRVSFCFFHWKHSWEHLRLAWRAPLPIPEKIKVVSYAFRMALWNREKLAGELRLAVTHFLS